MSRRRKGVVSELMKALVWLIVLLGCVPTCPAQLQFSAQINGANVVPPNHSPLSTVAEIGFGNGPLPFPGVPNNYLSCWVGFGTSEESLRNFGLFPVQASIIFPHGLPRTIDLFRFSFGAPEGQAPIVFFAGDFGVPLNISQIADLLAGKAYVKVTAANANGEEVPSAGIRGPIRLVPSFVPSAIPHGQSGIVGVIARVPPRILAFIAEKDGRMFATRSNQQGYFQIPLPPGYYTILLIDPTSGVVQTRNHIFLRPGSVRFIPF